MINTKQIINYLLIFLIATTLSITSFLLGYQWRMKEHSCEPVEIHTMNYRLDPGTDGILSIRIGIDSLKYVTFVQKGDTFALDAITDKELDELVYELYPVIQ